MRRRRLCAVVALSCVVLGACGSSGTTSPPGGAPADEAPDSGSSGSDFVDNGDFANNGDFADDDGSFTDEGDFADDGTDVGTDDGGDIGTDGAEPSESDAEPEPDWAGTYESGNYAKCDAKYPEEQEFLECMDGARP